MIFLQNPLTAHEASKAPAGHENNELSLKIIQLPEYIFGNATYATPIKFEIFGCQKALITKIEAKFHWEGHEKLIDISNRFVAYDGPQQNNGDSSIYTAFVPSSFYNNVLCYDYRSWSTEYELIVTFQPIDGNQSSPPVTLTSSQGSGKIAKAFADERIYCAELPVSEDETKIHEIPIEGTETYVANDGEIHFYNMQTREEVIPRQSLMAASGDPNTLAGISEADANNTKSDHSLESYVKLADYEGGAFHGTVYKATAYGNRIGSYFYISYGGKFVDPLGTEPVMDLKHKSGQFSADFAKGECVSIIQSKSNSGLNLFEITGTTMSILLAIVPPTAAVAPVVKYSLGAAAKIASIAASVDFDDPRYANASETFVMWGSVYCREGVAPREYVTSSPCVYSPDETTSIVTRLKIFVGNDRFTGCLVGDQHAFFVQTQAACSIEAQSNTFSRFGESLTVYGKSGFYTSAQGLRAMKVYTR